MKLSIIVLTHNSQHKIKGCLNSAKQADEIIIVDSGSTDDTLKIAKKYTAKIYSHQLTSFASQRTWGTQKVTSDWFMFLDDDERISKQLFQEIKSTIKNTFHSAFRFKRQNYFLGKKITHSGYWPDWQTRLFKSSKFKKITGASHEQPHFNGSLGDFSNPLLHLANRSIAAGLLKSYLWTKSEAEAFYKANHPSISWWRLIKVMLWEFCFRYFKQKGFKDGYVGFVEAIVQAINKFFIYQQIWELQHQQKINKKYQQLEKQLL